MSTYVVFFGGYHASQADMDAWCASARKQRGDVTFDAYPYLSAGASDTDAVAGAKDQFKEAIKKIQDSGADTLFIVGHSSGCAIANQLNKLLKDDPRTITLVDLDGFTPNSDQKRKGQDVQVWHAIGAGGQGRSLNCPDPCAAYNPKRLFHAPIATNIWSLHFSLVNTVATDAIVKKTYRYLGYAGCVANLCWLP